ncbi:hypothetical protein VULLAG_LOCUS16251 [Vulpes lagopus]
MLSPKDALRLRAAAADGDHRKETPAPSFAQAQAGLSRGAPRREVAVRMRSAVGPAGLAVRRRRRAAPCIRGLEAPGPQFVMLTQRVRVWGCPVPGWTLTQPTDPELQNHGDGGRRDQGGVGPPLLSQSEQANA